IAALASEAQKYFSSLMGPDGVTPLKIVAVRRGGGFSGGGVVLLDEGVFRRPKTDSQTAVVLSDAVAKIWLGNAARVSGDGYGVIREGLPRFLATEFIESRFGKDVADIERLRQRVAYGTVSRRDGTVTQISPLDDFYFTSMTNKGATIWRKLALDVGRDRLFKVLRSKIESGTVDLSGIRDALPEQKPFLDYAFDQVTDGNFLIGIPRREGNVSKVALRNTGPLAQTVKVAARTEAGETLSAFTTVEPKSFSEVVFESTSPVVVAEVDPEKLQLQADYSDDVAPRQFSENDLVLLVKSSFDKQDFAAAERDARAVLAAFPRFDDVRVLLARTLLAAGRTNEAEAQYRILQDEKLPSSRTIAWTYAGLGDIANQNSKPADASANYIDAILADADLGATIAARRGSAKLTSKIPDASLKEFFGRFDRAVLSNNKAEVDALILSGEMVRFSKGIAGQAQEWTSTILQTIELSSEYVSVEIGLAIRLLNKNSESGSAVMRLVKIDGSWKILSIDSFEVR
ncbi:MAG: tetratricopeptide repeat protein, partial [Acidobacteriota bacterium]